MAWLTPFDVESIYADACLTDAQLAHLQAQAEAVIGVHPDGVNASVKAVLVEVAKRWSDTVASSSEPSQEAAGPFSRSHRASPGLGLTDREKDALRTAQGDSGLWVMGMSRGPLEMPVPVERADRW